MGQYIWQKKGWPKFRWDSDALLEPLGAARKSQGKLLAEAGHLGLGTQVDVLTEEALMTAAIEGEKLNPEAERSSVARRLGLPDSGLSQAERKIDGLVEMLVDATENHKMPLTNKRLLGWHAALFPTGYSGLKQIVVGKYRTGNEPMQVVSGPMNRETVHYEAPPSSQVTAEMRRFLAWWSSSPRLDGLLRASIAHFWFVSIHPFEDGNGRIARAVSDMALSQDEQMSQRLYSMSSQIMLEREDYYNVLENAQKGDGEVTKWLLWFLQCFENHFLLAHIPVAVTRAETSAYAKPQRTGYIPYLALHKNSHLFSSA